jgi:arylsulfatase
MSGTKKTFAGLGEGAAWGLAFFGLEEVFSFALSQPGLTMGEVMSLLPIYLLLPAVVGAVAAGMGARGLVRSWSIFGGVAAFLLGGKFAHILSEKALPGLLGFPVAAVGVGIGVWMALRLSRDRPRLRWGGLVAAWLLAVGGLTANLGALASPVSKEALIWDGGIALAAGLAGWLVSRYCTPKPTRMALAIAALSWGLRGPVAWSTHQAHPEASTHTGAPIVLVVVDTLRADHLGIYGHGGEISPNMDALGNSGWVYTQANSASSWTLPATASLLTGRNPSRHGAGANLGSGNSNHGLNAQVPTLAEALSEAGYTTAGIVTNPWLKRLYGLGRGFDYYDDALGLGHNPLALQPMDQLGLALMQDRYYTPADRQVDKALAFVQSQNDNGWFLFVHLMDPHGPYNPPAKHIRGKAEDFEDPVQRLYEAEIRYTDAELGRLLSALPETAWVLLTSDHGEAFGEHPDAYPDQPIPGNTRHGHTLYQEVIHVPLIVRPPGGRAQQKVYTPVGSMDVAETIARIAGTTLGPDGDAKALLEVLGEGETLGRPVLSEAIRYGMERKALLDGAMKLIHSESEDEIYALGSDPGETDNLAATEPETLEALLQLLPENTVVAGTAAETSSAERERLKMLGYIDE